MSLQLPGRIQSCSLFGAWNSSIYVLPGPHLNLTEIKHVRAHTLCLTQWHNVETVPKSSEGRNIIFFRKPEQSGCWTSTKDSGYCKAPRSNTIVSRPSHVHRHDRWQVRIHRKKYWWKYLSCHLKNTMIVIIHWDTDMLSTKLSPDDSRNFHNLISWLIHQPHLESKDACFPTVWNKPKCFFPIHS